MLNIADDARLQVTAGIALLETSKLVTWDCAAEKFESVTLPEFECALGSFHPVFGRVICWIVFSAGAEFLAKGVCLLYAIPIRKQDCVLAYPPPEDIATWIKNFQPGSPRRLPTTNFGQIGDLYQTHLNSLCDKVRASVPKRNGLLASYELLGRTIRNRDAHAYVPKVRAEHFHLVKELFIPSINDLVSWSQSSAAELSEWRKDAQQFIDRLDLTIDQYLALSLCNEVASRKKSAKVTCKRLQNLTADDLDRVISFLDQLEASNTAR